MLLLNVNYASSKKQTSFLILFLSNTEPVIQKLSILQIHCLFTQHC